MQKIENKYTKQYQQFSKIPQSQRYAYSQKIHKIPMQDTDLDLPVCNPTYYGKVLASGEKDLHLTTYVWEARQTPKNILFVNHGLNGNVGSYQYLAKQFSLNSPTVVIGHDARHFGRSDGIPRSLIRSTSKLFQDLENVISWGLQKYGLSMGGLVILQTANRSKFNYKGIILLSPALVSSPISSLKLGIKQYFKIACLPESVIAEPTYQDSCRHRQFINIKVKPDPYIHQDGLLAGTAKSLGLSMRNGKQAIKKCTHPYLFIQSGTDKIVDPFVIKDFDKLSKSQDKTHFFSQDMWHSCCFDIEFLKMTPQIIKWVVSRSN